MTPTGPLRSCDQREGVCVTESVLQGLVGLSCLFLAGLGARTMFAPNSMVEILAVEPEGPAGLNTIRGFLGGLFIGSSIVLATGTRLSTHSQPITNAN